MPNFADLSVLLLIYPPSLPYPTFDHHQTEFDSSMAWTLKNFEALYRRPIIENPKPLKKWFPFIWALVKFNFSRSWAYRYIDYINAGDSSMASQTSIGLHLATTLYEGEHLDIDNWASLRSLTNFLSANSEYPNSYNLSLTHG